MSCSSSKNLDNWIGEYKYNEKSTEALAGYNMIMMWNLNIYKENNDYYAKIEINGQQTFMVIKAKIDGDDDQIRFCFDKEVDGFGFDEFKEGDVLFQLKRDKSNLVTNWNKLTPLLSENFKNNSLCFELKNK
jgi:hypothetical protein